MSKQIREPCAVHFLPTLSNANRGHKKSNDNKKEKKSSARSPSPKIITHARRAAFGSADESEDFRTAYLNGAQGAGVINIFSCMTRNSRVGGGHPSTDLVASARSRSRSPPSLYAQT